VAKQISTLDTLSGGRVRFGIGTGWQASEYDALEETFDDRGRRMDEAIRLLRACWSEETIDFQGEFYSMQAMAMEPKPPQGQNMPIWIGGTVPRALRRVAELGDGWMGMSFGFNPDKARRSIDTIHEHAAKVGRDPGSIGLQMSLTPSRGEQAQSYYTQPARMAEQALQLQGLGFNWATINLVELFRAGFRSVEALQEQMAVIHEALAGAGVLE
jgi:probable F420-dependent oxidoreductase